MRKEIKQGRKRLNKVKNARLNTQSTMESHCNSHKDSTQEEEKQITEIYFSYGENKTKLKDISRHSQDINLHIRTQGYNEGDPLQGLGSHS